MLSTEILTGIIVKSIAGFCYVEAGNTVYECKPRGVFRKEKISPVAGDKVDISLDGEKGTVEKIYDRKNLLIRPPLANLDKLFIVSSFATPDVNTLLIDRMVAIAEYLSITPVLIFNKSDLGDFGDIPKIYENIGYKVFTVSAENGDGVDTIKCELSGCLSAFSGNSGVGKSSLLNRLLPKLELNVGEVSEKLGRGRHTTRQVELFKVDGGYVADTPGFSSLELTDFLINDKNSLKFCYKDFEDYIDSCRFSDCSHTAELGCAVLNAVNDGKIAKSRHESYVQMYDSLKNIKSWELNK